MKAGLSWSPERVFPEGADSERREALKILREALDRIDAAPGPK